MHASTTRTMKPSEWLLLIFLAILWGGSFFFGKVALQEVKPLTIVLARVGIAALALDALLVFSGLRTPNLLAKWKAFSTMGLLNNLVPFSLIFWGQSHIPSSSASILNASAPVWAVLPARFYTREERLSLNRSGGVFFGLTGVAIMIGTDALRGSGVEALAQSAVVGAAISYAFAGIYGKRFKDLPPLATAAGQLTATTVIMLPPPSPKGAMDDENRNI